jgi:hypothetical protein
MLWLFVVIIPLTLVVLLALVETPKSEREPRRVSPRAYQLGQWLGRRLLR